MSDPLPPSGEQPTGPLRTRSPVWWALALVLLLALMGYAFWGARVRGHQVTPADDQSGRGLPAPTAPAVP